MTSEEAQRPELQFGPPSLRKDLGTVYQRITRPETLFRHVFAEDEGFLVTFTGKQARFTNPEARPNELADTRQLSWPYPKAAKAAEAYLIDEAQRQRDCNFGTHLSRGEGTPRAANTAPTARALWFNEEEG